MIYSKRGEYVLAESEYRSAIKLYRGFPAAHYNLGNDLLLRGDHRQAVKSFSRALRLYPTDVWALNNRGLAHMKQGQMKKARRNFEGTLQIQPGFSQAAENLSGLVSTEDSP